MKREIKENIGKRLTTALAVNDKMQKELARFLGVTDNTVSFFCSGSRAPNHEQIKKIAQYLHISTDYLLGLTDVMTGDKDVQFICDYTGLSGGCCQMLAS